MSEQQTLKVDVALQPDNDQPSRPINNEKQINNQEQYQDEEEDDEIAKLPSNLLPKQPQKEKLVEQNIKLKAQIYELALQLDQILLKDRQKKKKYGLPTLDDDDEAVKASKLELKRQELKIIDVKNHIFELKRQLDSVFNNSVVQEKENRLKQLHMKIKYFEDEKEGLIKIQKGQAKAIKNIKNEEEFKEKIEKVHRELMKRKEDTHKLIEKVQDSRKREIDCHESYIIKRQKVRELEAKMAANKEKGKQKNKNKINLNKDTISNEMISELQQEIKKLQKQKKEGEKVWQDKIRLIEVELQAKRQEEERKLLILKEKEKQYKLNQIRIRELRKLVRQNAMGDQDRKRPQEMDMSQFRHKRNIRYIEK